MLSTYRTFVSMYTQSGHIEENKVVDQQNIDNNITYYCGFILQYVL